MSTVCPNHDCPDCPVCDRILAALQAYPGERVDLDDIAARTGHQAVLIHLLHMWKAGKAAPDYDGNWSTPIWPEHETDCEMIWEAT